ncbi:hypothetical protein [Arthrobacter pityocampae]|uniref:hypothetical protein n=1 Tax=Arthrobacter pityocampae TaxID=547334 RepID=UPI001882ACE3|nr:hypothetical protein [Arthrobacter pityocampae]
MIGVRRKNKKIIVEGAIYLALFLGAVSVPSDSTLFSLAAFVGFGVFGVSAIRSYMLRDLWLHRKIRGQLPTSVVPQQAPTQRAYQSAPSVAQTASSAADLSPALTWVASHAKQNKHRLPAGAYVTILETCQTLDAVIDAETQHPTTDAQFEYELAAIVREFLPTVLQGYLAIPPNMVSSPQSDGRTADQELIEQLQLLSKQADTLHSSRHSRTSAELTSTGNFLRERFGHHKQRAFDLDI